MKPFILFDLDQTLLNRHQSLISFLNWQINFLQLVPQIKKTEFIERFLELDQNGKVWKDIVYEQLIQEFAINNVEANELLQIYINDFNKFCVPFEDATETIQNLVSKGHTLGLISNGKSPFQENNFKALGFNEYFSSVIVSAAVKLRKPDSKIFEYASAQLNCTPEQCIFVGDSAEADMFGAKNAGMKTIYFAEQPVENIPIHADLHIQRYLELEAAILKLSNDLD